MGYQNDGRPDYDELKKALLWDFPFMTDEEIRQEYRQWLLTDAQMDLTDLINDIKLGKSQADLIENIQFIKATILQYTREVYPAPPEEEDVEE
jgi:hypothetical protein